MSGDLPAGRIPRGGCGWYLATGERVAIEQGDLPYLVLEYLEGRDLDSVLTESGRVAVPTACTWCADACDGVAEAHDLGVVHRDTEPSHVFLARGDGAPTVKVLDFGIAAGEPTADRPVGHSCR